MRRVTVSGTTLFHVAAAELGDATQWLRIARLNRLDDPMVDGLVTLDLPERDPTEGGGVARQ